MFKKIFESAGPYKKNMYVATVVVLVSVLMGVLPLVLAGCSYVVQRENGQIKESYPLDESGSKKVLDFFRIRQ